MSGNFKRQKYIYYGILLLLIFIVIASVAYSVFFSVGSGFLKADEYTVDSPFLAYVDKIYVSAGDEVYKGEALAHFRYISGLNYGKNSNYLVANFSGKVVDKFCNEGEIVNPGEKIFLIEKENFYVLAFFKESDLKYLVKGMPVKVVFKEGKVFTGNIKRVLSVIYPINEFDEYRKPTNRFIPVLVNVPNLRGTGLPYNAYAKVYINKIRVMLWKKENH